MTHRGTPYLWVVCVIALGCPASEDHPSLMEPPQARVSDHELVEHDGVRNDPYYWLNERDNPEVVGYLEAENVYADAVMAHTEGLQKKLFQEITGRIQPTDLSVPYRLDDYYYYTRFEPDHDYAIYCRKKGTLEAPEEVMLDANELARDHDFLSVGTVSVSSGQDLLAYAVDTVGRRFYTLNFKDLATGDRLNDTIPQVTGNMAWANDNKTLFYTKQHPSTLRSYRIYRHVLGEDADQDVLIYEESDETFGSSVFKTKSKKFVMIASFHTLSSEYRYLDANDPRGSFTIVLPRQSGHEYQVDHFDDHFFIRTNDGAKNFRLIKTPVGAPGRESWQEVLPHRNEVYLSGFEIFKDHLVVSERRDGLIHMRVLPWSGGEGHYLEFDEPAYSAYIGTNPEFDTPILRFSYTSLTTPRSVYDYDTVRREKKLLKRQEILGDFDPSNYETERLHAVARDGTAVPISLVYRKGLERDGTNPLLLHGYGSYGASRNPSFGSARLSLLDRGFIYAIAHIRGGQEMGREWYEDGKLFNKKNTFTDFVDCAKHLIAERYTSSERLFAMGGSAGGLLMGAVVNMRPDLFKGVIAHVPFVDVITTMLDDSIPLTTREYDEWGDPHQKDYYEYMLSYSPYDNVAAKDYPNLLVTTGLHDSQVQYWEPAKWVAKLRAKKTDHNRLLLKTNLSAGHGGATGRYKRHRETAVDYAFLLDLAGITD